MKVPPGEKTIGIRVPEKLHTKVRREAAKDGVPMSKIWVRAILAYFEAFQ